MSFPRSHVVAPHGVPVGYSAQPAPPASHVPFVAQLAAPASTHAVAQQTLPAPVLLGKQWPCWHSSFVTQGEPSGASAPELDDPPPPSPTG